MCESVSKERCLYEKDYVFVWFVGVSTQENCDFGTIKTIHFLCDQLYVCEHGPLQTWCDAKSPLSFIFGIGSD